MVMAGEHPSTLFRSLRPDDEDFQASTSAAAREAEQRWPLFKAVAPRKQQPTPLLSPQERSLWSTTQKPSGHEHKPALSLPGTGNKMAQSLSKMGGRPAAATLSRSRLRTEEEQPYEMSAPTPQKFSRDEPAKKSRLLFSRNTATAAVDHPVQEPVRKPQKFGHEEPVKGRSSLFSKDTVTAEVKQPIQESIRAPQRFGGEEPARGRGSLFSKASAPVAAEEKPEIRSVARADDSLTRLFSRLEGQEEVVEKPVSKRSSFLGRLGRR